MHSGYRAPTDDLGRPDSDEWVTWQQDWIEDYLDHLCAPLVGLVPCRERRSLRLEVEGHLLALIEGYEETGLDPEAATTAALREHGEPWRIGQAFLGEWSQGASHHRLARCAGIATWTAFAIFGIAAMPILLWVQVQMLLRDSPDPFHGLIATPFLLLLLLAPWIAGGVTGATTPVRPVPAVARALGLLLLAALGAGLLMLPSTAGLSLALVECLYWLPAGCLAAWLGAMLGLCSRRRRFLNPRGFASHRSP